MCEVDIVTSILVQFCSFSGHKISIIKAWVFFFFFE